MQTAFSTRELSSGGILSGRLATNSKPPYLTAVVPHLKAARSNRLSQPVAGRASETHQEYQSLGGDQEPAVQDQLCSSQQQQAARRSNPYPLKNVQLGHSRFSRGAPHVCYGQVGSSGIFYIKPEVDELIDDWQQWLAQPRQYWQQRQQQFERWATSQKEQLPDYSKDQHGWNNIRHATGTSSATTGCSSSGGGSSAGSSDSSSQQSRQSLLASIRSSGGVAGGVGIAAAAAATVLAVVTGRATFACGQNGLHALRKVLLGAVAGATCLLLMLQCSKLLVTVLLLCYAGIFVV